MDFAVYPRDTSGSDYDVTCEYALLGIPFGHSSQDRHLLLDSHLLDPVTDKTGNRFSRVFNIWPGGVTSDI